MAETPSSAAPAIVVADAQTQLLDHPDVRALNGADMVYYVWEFRNETLGTGPHVAFTGLAKAYSIVKDREKFNQSHPHILIDKSKGFQAFPHIFAAIAEADRRVKLYNLKDPSRVNANELFPGEPNRILEAGKPDEHPDIVGR